MEYNSLDKYIKKITDIYDDEDEDVVIYDIDILINTINKLRNALKGFNNVKLLFAVKANNNEKILEILSDYIDGVDIASVEELKICENIFKNNLISINGTEFSYKQLSEFIDRGYNVDLNSIDQLYSIKNKKKYGIRLALMDKQFNRESRFGLNIFDENVIELVKQKATYINRIHIHSDDKSDKFIWQFNTILNQLNNLKLLKYIEEINIGGGFKSLDEVGFKKFFESINYCLKQYNLDSMTIYLEPGYSLISSCGFLCSRVNSRFIEENEQYLVVNTSAYRNFLWFAPIPINLYCNSNRCLSTSIFGNTCYENDIFCEKQFLPPLNEKDAIIFYPAGAYSRSNYNNLHSKSYPKELIIGDYYE